MKYQYVFMIFSLSFIVACKPEFIGYGCASSDVNSAFTINERTINFKTKHNENRDAKVEFNQLNDSLIIGVLSMQSFNSVQEFQKGIYIENFTLKLFFENKNESIIIDTSKTKFALNLSDFQKSDNFKVISYTINIIKYEKCLCCKELNQKNIQTSNNLVGEINLELLGKISDQIKVYDFKLFINYKTSKTAFYAA